LRPSLSSTTIKRPNVPPLVPSGAIIPPPGGRAEAAPCLCEPSKIGVATRRLTNRPGTIEVDVRRRMTRRMTRRREETLGRESVEARRESLAGDDIALSTPPSLVLQPMHDLVAGGIAGSVSVVVGRE